MRAHLFSALLLLGTLAGAEPVVPVAPKTSFPDPGAAATYKPESGVVVVDISEYAGYGGLIVANGGMEPSADSFFAKTCGFRVRLVMTEGEKWAELNGGKLAATVTTADVLPLMGRGMDAVVPLLLSYSRGADGLVVRSDIKRVNDLVGQIVVVGQFLETEFFLRYLAQEEGEMAVAVLPTPDAKPRADAINLAFTEDGEKVGEVFSADLEAGTRRYAGCVAWAPITTEVVAASAGAARQLTSNRNLLIIADVLLVNGGLAKAQPQIVAGLVHGALEGNRRLRSDPERNLPIVATAFGWDLAKARDELAKVHLANHAENLAFFNGTMDAAGSYGFITGIAGKVYESYLGNPVDCQRFTDLNILRRLERFFPGEQVDIQMIGVGAQEVEPVLTRDVRLQFDDGINLSGDDEGNRKILDGLAQTLRTSPGSILVLVGHVEPTRRAELEKSLGKMKAMMAARSLGQGRAEAVRKVLVDTRRIDASRIQILSRGWEQPLANAANPRLNRRVEVQLRLAQ